MFIWCTYDIPFGIPYGIPHSIPDGIPHGTPYCIPCRSHMVCVWYSYIIHVVFMWYPHGNDNDDDDDDAHDTMLVVVGMVVAV